MKQITTIATVEVVKKIKNSAFGNPAYEVRIETADKVIYGRTAPNAMCSYMLWHGFSAERKISYHKTSSGRTYLDYIY